MMDCLANRTIFGLDAEEHERLKDLIYELWSGPAGSVPDSEAVLKTLRKVFDELTCTCFDPRQAFPDRRTADEIDLHPLPFKTRRRSISPEFAAAATPTLNRTDVFFRFASAMCCTGGVKPGPFPRSEA